MRTRILVFVLTFSFILPLLTAQTNARLSNQSTTTSAASADIAAAVPVGIPSPEDVLGFVPGDDRKLASWSKVIEYFDALASSAAIE